MVATIGYRGLRRNIGILAHHLYENDKIGRGGSIQYDDQRGFYLSMFDKCVRKIRERDSLLLPIGEDKRTRAYPKGFRTYQVRYGACTL